MMSHTAKTARVKRSFSVLCAVLGCCFSGPASNAADSGEREVEWAFKSGLDKAAFAEAFKSLTKDGYRIVDLESYRSGRSSTASTIWTKLAPDQAWKIEMSLPITEFLAAHKKHQGDGFALVELEADRTGATLHFSGVWLRTQKGLETEFHFGMESLEFSNRYGEMADRGFRLIDFEAYESNGKYRHSAIWAPNEGYEVRFYRAIDKNRFSEVANAMAQGGFRLLDIEGYQYEGKFVFAGAWVRSSEGQQHEYAFDLLADEFYNKNTAYMNDGYRLTEFEAYEDNGNIYYAGSWLKGGSGTAPTPQAEPAKKKKSMSLEAFRSEGK